MRSENSYFVGLVFVLTSLVGTCLKAYSAITGYLLPVTLVMLR